MEYKTITEGENSISACVGTDIQDLIIEIGDTKYTIVETDEAGDSVPIEVLKLIKRLMV